MSPCLALGRPHIPIASATSKPPCTAAFSKLQIVPNGRHLHVNVIDCSYCTNRTLAAKKICLAPLRYNLPRPPPQAPPRKSFLSSINPPTSLSRAWWCASRTTYSSFHRRNPSHHIKNRSSATFTLPSHTTEQNGSTTSSMPGHYCSS